MAFIDKEGKKKFRGTLEGEAQNGESEVVTQRDTARVSLYMDKDLKRRIRRAKGRIGCTTMNAAAIFLINQALNNMKIS